MKKDKKVVPVPGGGPKTEIEEIVYTGLTSRKTYLTNFWPPLKGEAHGF